MGRGSSIPSATNMAAPNALAQGGLRDQPTHRRLERSGEVDA